jgi:hypothetical protein
MNLLEEIGGYEENRLLVFQHFPADANTLVVVGGLWIPGDGGFPVDPDIGLLDRPSKFMGFFF